MLAVAAAKRLGAVDCSARPTAGLHFNMLHALGSVWLFGRVCHRPVFALWIVTSSTVPIEFLNAE